MAYEYEKEHREVYASMVSQWKHLFTMFVEAIDRDDLENSAKYRATLEEVFVNTADTARDLFLRLMEAEQKLKEMEQSPVAG
jgi:hypothetical protein